MTRWGAVIVIIVTAGFMAEPASAVQGAYCTNSAQCWASTDSSVSNPGFNGVGANIRVNCIGGSNIYDLVDFGVQLVQEQNSQIAWYRVDIRNGFSGPYFVWSTYGPHFGVVIDHDAGPYTLTQSAPLWIAKNTSPGVQATIVANGAHYTAEGAGWPAENIRAGLLRTNSTTSKAYGSASSIFYLTLSGDVHEGMDTNQTTPWGAVNPYVNVSSQIGAGSGAYFVSWPSWMRAFNNTPVDGCPII